MKPAFQRRAFWSFAGLALLGLAGWETVQTALAGRNAAGFTLPPPLRTRSGERPMLRRETAAGDPIAHYLARAKRGMTEREVRWMIEDFEAAGLDRTVEQLADLPAAMAQRKKQEAWYLAALGDGLSLTPAQRDEAKAKLQNLFVRDAQNYEKLIESGLQWKREHPGQRLCGADLTEASRRFYCFPSAQFFDASFAPWNLAQLTENQSAVTLRYWLIEDWKRETEDDPFGGGERTEPDYWLYTAKGREMGDPFAEADQPATSRPMPGLPAMQDPLTGNLTEFPLFTELPALVAEDGHRFEAYLPCGDILPLTPDQMRLWEKSYDWAAQAQLCHPAQLRLALLQQPSLAKMLREELDHDPSERGLKIPIKPAAPSPSE